jgi:hypothetical protein
VHAKNSQIHKFTEPDHTVTRLAAKCSYKGPWYCNSNSAPGAPALGTAAEAAKYPSPPTLYLVYLCTSLPPRSLPTGAWCSTRAPLAAPAGPGERAGRPSGMSPGLALRRTEAAAAPPEPLGGIRALRSALGGLSYKDGKGRLKFAGEQDALELATVYRSTGRALELASQRDTRLNALWRTHDSVSRCVNDASRTLQGAKVAMREQHASATHGQASPLRAASAVASVGANQVALGGADAPQEPGAGGDDQRTPRRTPRSHRQVR